MKYVVEPLRFKLILQVVHYLSLQVVNTLLQSINLTLYMTDCRKVCIAVLLAVIINGIDAIEVMVDAEKFIVVTCVGLT